MLSRTSQQMHWCSNTAISDVEWLRARGRCGVDIWSQIAKAARWVLPTQCQHEDILHNHSFIAISWKTLLGVSRVVTAEQGEE